MKTQNFNHLDTINMISTPYPYWYVTQSSVDRNIHCPANSILFHIIIMYIIDGEDTLKPILVIMMNPVVLSVGAPDVSGDTVGDEPQMSQ